MLQLAARSALRVLPLLAATLGALAGPVPGSAPRLLPAEDDGAATAPLFARVGVLGASVSHGFGIGLEVRAQLSFAEVLAATIAAETSVVRVSTPQFFLAPTEHGAETVTELLARRPTLVVAVDFLFWYGYGDVFGGEDARLARLERGLAELERFDVPLVVADFPDVSPALQGELFGMPPVRPAQIPAAETLGRLSARVRAWAAERGNVVVVPLAEFLAHLHANEPLAVRASRWSGARETMLQKDLLHPTLDGTIALALLVADGLERAREDVPPSAFLWDAAAVRERVLERTAAEREKALERERRREERQRKREERERERAGKGGDGAAGGSHAEAA